MAKHMTIRHTYGLASSVPVSTNFIAGVELEIESVEQHPTSTGWSVTEDGSLRNGGYEYISSPSTKEQLKDGFKQIHKTIRLGSNPFSERTSIHVHVNMLDLTQEQVRSILLHYALFEPFFFGMVAANRRNNIHCVGLDQTTLSEQYRRTLPLIVQKWSKYTALNLLPLKTQGTVEFRHMEGHNDVTRFNAWLDTLENLWSYGQSNILHRNLLGDEHILKAFDTIFADSPVKTMRPVVLSTIADSIIDVKLALL